MKKTAERNVYLEESALQLNITDPTNNVFEIKIISNISTVNQFDSIITVSGLINELMIGLEVEYRKDSSQYSMQYFSTFRLMIMEESGIFLVAILLSW